MTACSRCGVIAEQAEREGPGPDAPPPPGWSWSPTERGIEWMCPPCTRANVRSIEAKLPEEWW